MIKNTFNERFKIHFITLHKLIIQNIKIYKSGATDITVHLSAWTTPNLFFQPQIHY